MSIELKFKIWIPYSKMMMQPKTIIEIQESQISGVTIGQMKQWQWLQYSGMNDRYNEGIYRGDILELITQNGQKINVICEFDINKRFTLDTGWELDIPSFYFKRKDGLNSYPIVENYAGMHDLQKMEIIGNIYQHPELAF